MASVTDFLARRLKLTVNAAKSTSTRGCRNTDIAGVRTELASLETRLIRWMVGTVIATATLTVGILRLLWMTTSKVPRPQAAI